MGPAAAQASAAAPPLQLVAAQTAQVRGDGADVLALAAPVAFRRGGTAKATVTARRTSSSDAGDQGSSRATEADWTAGLDRDGGSRQWWWNWRLVSAFVVLAGILFGHLFNLLLRANLLQSSVLRDNMVQVASCNERLGAEVGLVAVGQAFSGPLPGGPLKRLALWDVCSTPANPGAVSLAGAQLPELLIYAGSVFWMLACAQQMLRRSV